MLISTYFHQWLEAESNYIISWTALRNSHLTSVSLRSDIFSILAFLASVKNCQFWRDCCDMFSSQEIRRIHEDVDCLWTFTVDPCWSWSWNNVAVGGNNSTVTLELCCLCWMLMSLCSSDVMVPIVYVNVHVLLVLWFECPSLQYHFLLFPVWFWWFCSKKNPTNAQSDTSFWQSSWRIPFLMVSHIQFIDLLGFVYCNHLVQIQPEIFCWF